jgi:glycosyltransferase involved in cell wall biosynthesis
VIPVYNVEKYIRDCLDSVKKQTYKNLEVIIVDDGTPDNSGVIADEYAEKDIRFSVIHKYNAGVASARNAGLKKASGEFILFIDPDDWISEDHVEYLLTLQCIENSDMCISTLLYTQRNEEQSKNIYVKTITAEKASALLLSPKTYVGSYGKLYRTDWLIKNQIFQNEKIYSGEGLNFTINAAQHANSVTISNRKIYYYRRNVSKSATTRFDLKMITNNEYSLNIIKDEAIKTNREFDIMWRLFRTHLFISGIIAIKTYASKEQYFEEYTYWMNTIKKDRFDLIMSSYVPLKSKVRIIAASLFPGMWSKLATAKRKKIFNKSV